MRKITHLIIHCTDSPDSALGVGLKEVRSWHLQRGWSDIGYHWLIDKNGQEWSGRKESQIGAHAKGYNSFSIGIVWVGRNVCNASQWYKLGERCAKIVKKYKIPIENVLGHCEIPEVNKTCPNINMTQMRNLIEQLQGDI